ncbi:hypothetical protein [Streptomyces sp. MST-110588]|uniref:TolB family protein n=1 Tax=Streptomyces sp. MST-110588 TaxID=2833628 RepID=UPI001F5CA424|nr:hypothetical protein [Streptomyces sp. MST-110588]UNO43329.1 PD40 domain-containing protein [Streptomyces sp. MST-110588]
MPVRARVLLGGAPAVACCAAALLAPPAAAGAGTGTESAHKPRTEWASAPWQGAPDRLTATAPAVSGNGRYVAFQAGPRVTGPPGPPSGSWQIHVRDLWTGAVETVSVTADGRPSAKNASTPAISDDGRYVSFTSPASDLVPGDTNNAWDVFVRDRHTGTTRRVSMDQDGGQIAGGAFYPALSGDGHHAAFQTRQALDPEDTNKAGDIFVRDLRAGTTRRVSLADDGAQSDGESRYPELSRDGRTVAFISDAGNLVHDGPQRPGQKLYVRDLRAGTTVRGSVYPDGTVSGVSLSDGALSPDGRYAAFTSGAHVYLRDLRGRSTRQVDVTYDGSEPSMWSYKPKVSPQGRYVHFGSNSDNLVPGDTNGWSDVFVRDLREGTTRRLSLTHDGAQAERGISSSPSPSLSGRVVAFESNADNLVPQPTGGTDQVFVRRSDRAERTDNSGTG